MLHANAYPGYCITIVLVTVGDDRYDVGVDRSEECVDVCMCLLFSFQNNFIIVTAIKFPNGNQIFQISCLSCLILSWWLPHGIVCMLGISIFSPLLLLWHMSLIFLLIILKTILYVGCLSQRYPQSCFMYLFVLMIVWPFFVTCILQLLLWLS